MKTYDAIIIGAGQSGGPLAGKLAEEGLRTALIEKKFVGGTCINVGCTPTKTMIASGRIAHLAANSKDWGIITSEMKVDMPAIKKRKDDIVTSFREGSEKKLLQTEGLDLIYGEATFTGFKTVTVKLNNGVSEELTADKIFIDTGAETFIPGIDGIHDVGFLTSSTILDLEIVPEHLLVIGASYIALEFGQLYRRLGSNVTILEQGPQFLKREDEDIAEALKKILEEDGITIHLNGIVKKLRKTSGEGVEAILEVNGVEQNITCSHVLLAVGRTPQTEALNLAKTGVATGKHGAIEVNDKLETNVAGIYAMGDVKGGPAFTHISYNDYVIVYQNLFQQANLTIKNRLVPYCVFTDPQLARVGITEKEASDKGMAFIVAKLSMSSVARAIETNETRGFIKAIVDKTTKKILGVAVLGVEGGEIMSVLQMAMMGGVTYDQLKYAVFAHPTYSESLNNLFMQIKD
ncbi:MAG: mercuric reductase [Segetibacter sp.]|jgi:pyruvate/2-oxoglutarate dehydrogenase complex dihydrolipoamide dehydrogenase (E3) component|nr:mercuric reductase [Segetibacter sp.]